MTIREKNIETITGWSLEMVLNKAKEWGADFNSVSIEPVSLGPGMVSVPAMIEYEKE